MKTLVFPKTLGEVTLGEAVSKIDSHFKPKPNEIAESYKFHTRNQEKNESMKDFIAAL